MLRGLGLGFAACLVAGQAAAQQPGDFRIWPDIVLEANGNGNGYMANGVGAPAVAYDTDQQRYVMAFEVRLSQEDPACPVGMWALGVAISDDGISNWTTLPAPLVSPTPGTFHSCVAAHPSVIYWPPTRTIFIYFKAEQTDPPDPTFGPDRYTGVGRVRIKVGQGGGVRSVLLDAFPVMPVSQNFGIPRVVHQDGEFRMALTLRPDAWMATGANSGNYSLDPGPVLSPQGAYGPHWAADEFFNASLVCEDDPTFPLSLFIGGRTLGQGAQILVAGWGKAISSDGGASWLLQGTPFFEWSGDTLWRHWDVLRVGTSDYLVWWDEKDPNDRNRIRFASTVDTWNDTDVYSKVCP